MTRLMIFVEGQTEEEFVNCLLSPYLCNNGFLSVSARLMGNPRARKNRGGVRSWTSVRKEIIHHLQKDRTCLITLMVDFYGLPESSGQVWPGRKEANNKDFLEKSKTVEIALYQDILQESENKFNPDRFIPYIIMHEFEALLFSDCHSFMESIAKPNLVDKFEEIKTKFGSPEEINDSLETAPSKRIKQLIPSYDKVLWGNISALDMGIEKILEECPLFNQWVENLVSKVTK